MTKLDEARDRVLAQRLTDELRAREDEFDVLKLDFESKKHDKDNYDETE